MSTISISPIEPGAAVAPSTAPRRAEGFAATLENAIGSVAELQNAGDLRSAELASGSGNLHETALALEKADVGMRMLVKVRNKLVDAYNEVMRMSI